MEFLIILPIVLAFSLGAYTIKLKDKSDDVISKYALITTGIVSIVAFVILILCFDKKVTIIEFSQQVSLSFKVDGLSVVFAGLVAFLWPLATYYATRYMTHEGKLGRFFTFYTMTFATVLAIAFSANIFTMYLFYEVLTFITLPLVTHNNENRDTYAGKKYLVYSVGGAAISFIGMMMFMHYGHTWEFAFGGSIAMFASDNLLFAYLLMFIGFSVKTGMFPFHSWLVGAGVAPTPVTALLHAVAVVKAGAFAIIRVTYYLFDPQSLSGTWVQYICITMCIITIVFGSSMAIKSKHLKRRFAYSTVSQLSYIVLATVCMNKLGLIAACLHIIFHALMKIVIFYTAGSVMFVTHKEYVQDIQGYAKAMPATFITFLFSGVALVGVPPFSGFISKFAIAQSLIQTGGTLSFIAISALILSSLLTAIYIFQIIALAFLPFDDFDAKSLKKIKKTPKELTITVTVLTATMLVVSLFGNNIYTFLEYLLLGGI